MDITAADPSERAHRTGWRRDLRLALFCLAGGLVLLSLGVYDGGAVQPRYLLIVPLVVMCGALMLRRVAPIPAVLVGAAAGIGDVLLGPSLGALLVFTQVIYDASLYGRRWLQPWLLRIAVAVTVVASLATLLLSPVEQGVTVAVTLTLVMVLPVVTAGPVLRYRERARTERERAEQVVRLADLDRQRAELDRRQAVASERARMARELHDVIANHLSAVAIHATAAQSLPNLDPERLRDVLTVIRQNSVQGLTEMRRLVEFLRDPAEADGAVDAIGRRLADVAGLVGGTAGVTARLEQHGEPRELPAEVDLAGYRIVQESLTNAGKHAGGGSAVVRIDHHPEKVVIVVDSWGPPGGSRPSVTGAGMGLIGMRERAMLVGGAFTAGPHEGGWRVWAELPVVVPSRKVS